MYPETDNTFQTLDIDYTSTSHLWGTADKLVYSEIRGDTILLSIQEYGDKNI